MPGWQLHITPALVSRVVIPPILHGEMMLTNVMLNHRGVEMVTLDDNLETPHHHSVNGAVTTSHSATSLVTCKYTFVSHTVTGNHHQV